MEYTDGIYFDMPEADYHALPRLSNSGIKKLLVSPADFWVDSWMNPDKEEKSTGALNLGKAYHAAVFEPEYLNERFVSSFNASQYAGILTNATQVGEELAKRGETKKKTGENAADQIERLLATGYQGRILSVEQAKWEEERGDRIAIPADAWEQLQKDMDLLYADELINARVSGGFAEVAVLWTDERTGIAMKCKFDKIKEDCWIDYKSFDNTREQSLEQCLADAMRYRKYYIQAYLYHTVIELIREEKIKCDWSNWRTEQVALLKSILARKSPLPIWYVFQQKSGVANILEREIHIMKPEHVSNPVNAGGVDDEIREEVGERTRRLSALGALAEAEVTQAMNWFGYCMDTYGPDKPWGALKPTGVIDDDCFPPYWLGLEEKF